MSIRALESAITSEARRIFNNPKLRVKDLMEWSTGQINPQDGEVVEKMPLNGVYVAIKTECDKRANGEVRGASRLAGEASSAEGATSTVVLERHGDNEERKTT